jgi:nucleotide-binding universal stress UspA family protein
MSHATILCPTDFSAHSVLALEHAAIYARAAEATVVIVHVEDVDDASAGEGMLHSGVRPEGSEALRRRLEAVVPGEGLACEYRLVAGRPAAEILRVAEEENVDRIVMGTHGRTGVRRMLLGSVAEQVLRKAKCTVVTVRGPRD